MKNQTQNMLWCSMAVLNLIPQIPTEDLLCETLEQREKKLKKKKKATFKELHKYVCMNTLHIPFTFS